MNAQTHVQTLVAIALTSLAMSPALGQQAGAMRQGDYSIIIEGSERIQETLREVQDTQEVRKTQVEEMTHRVEEHLEKVRDENMAQEERELHNARGLENRALINLAVYNTATENLERFAKIDGELGRMIEVSRNLGSDSSDPAHKERLNRLRQMSLDSLENEQRILDLANQGLDSLPWQAEQELQLSQSMFASSVEVARHTNTAFDDMDLTQRLEGLRDSIGHRRNHLLAIRQVADGNLRMIQMIAFHNGVTMSINELTVSLDGISSLADPLAIDYLQPGLDQEFLMTPTPSGRTIQGAGRGNRSGGGLRPTMERINRDHL